VRHGGRLRFNPVKAPMLPQPAHSIQFQFFVQRFSLDMLWR